MYHQYMPKRSLKEKEMNFSLSFQQCFDEMAETPMVMEQFGTSQRTGILITVQTRWLMNEL